MGITTTISTMDNPIVHIVYMHNFVYLENHTVRLPVHNNIEDRCVYTQIYTQIYTHTHLHVHTHIHMLNTSWHAQILRAKRHPELRILRQLADEVSPVMPGRPNNGLLPEARSWCPEGMNVIGRGLRCHIPFMKVGRSIISR